MTEAQFSQSRKGQAFVAILSHPGAIERIVAFSRKDRPAVEAIDADVAETIGALSDTEKQAAGRIVKRVLGDLGLRPVKKGQRVLGGRIFSRGTVYREVAPRLAATAAPLPLNAATAVTTLPVDSADRFRAAHALLLAGRRNPDAALPGVDDFLVDRRAQWDAG
jgi:hypothetical protein